MAWVSNFLLGRPGAELAFSINPNQIDIESAQIRVIDAVRKLESELGKELRYTALSTDQFLYRLQMNDHLIKDIFDYPHTLVYDKLNIGLK